ncbi:ABC transporter family substrate-binding protein [Streptomyces flavofungini]|uniref:ABC transporter family substrate-binding protein n=1 Tax=Streptomyces flavofungini TaxID=68200 RepID=UPI0025B27C40|nr:ABC transporter family substrate-binding protein [Streptomyces flavofungini]WJV51019.1 ABC transporter family substrate-binding protein [Streptomyces flavofungini]
MHPVRKVLTTVVAAAVCASLGTACSTQEDEPSSKPPGASQVNPVDRAGLKKGGTLSWPLTVIQENLNIRHLDGGHVDTRRVMESMMPVIMKSDDRGRVAPDPDYLASAVSRVRSGRQQVTYRINKEARWSDGSPLTYRDFEANWRAQNGRDAAFHAVSHTGYELITKVSRGAGGDREVIVDFARPFGEWRSLFTPLYPASVIRTPQGFNNGYRGGAKVTAGPFTFAHRDETAKTLTVVRDDAWWGDRPLLDKIVFRALDPGAHAGAFANGEADFFDVGVKAAAYRAARDTPHAQIRRAGSPTHHQLTMNGQSPLLKDARVRRALARAIDRRRITQVALQGVAADARPLGNHFLLPQQDGYRDNSGQVGTYDPAAARTALDEAGWHLDGSVRKKAGKELALDYLAVSGNDELQNEGRVVQAMLRDVGARVKLTFVPEKALFERHIIPGKFDLTVFNWTKRPFPVSVSRSIYVKPKGKDIQLNFARTGTPRIDALLDEAATATDQGEALDLINRADRLIWREAAAIPLYQEPGVVASRQDLANLGAQGYASVVYQDIGFTR